MSIINQVHVKWWTRLDVKLFVVLIIKQKYNVSVNVSIFIVYYTGNLNVRMFAEWWKFPGQY